MKMKTQAYILCSEN